MEIEYVQAMKEINIIIRKPHQNNFFGNIINRIDKFFEPKKINIYLQITDTNKNDINFCLLNCPVNIPVMNLITFICHKKKCSPTLISIYQNHQIDITKRDSLLINQQKDIYLDVILK